MEGLPNGTDHHHAEGIHWNMETRIIKPLNIAIRRMKHLVDMRVAEKARHLRLALSFVSVGTAHAASAMWSKLSGSGRLACATVALGTLWVKGSLSIHEARSPPKDSAEWTSPAKYPLCSKPALSL